MYDKLKLIDSQRKSNLRREIRILQKLDHPNIIKLINIVD